ncbi:MAG: SHOCT domain-containing protein [Armatimonadota bacterium]
MCGPYGWGAGPLGWIGMLIGLIVWLLILGGLVYLVVWLIRRFAAPHESALDVLSKRYARGEIDREEYERMKRELSS